MVITVTLNPALDHIASIVARLTPGAIHRCSGGVFRPGGKGLNVSLLLHSLGMETRALGLAAGFTGREIARLAEEEGCPTDFTFLPLGNSRLNTQVLSPGEEGEQETYFAENGPPVTPEDLAPIREKLSALGPDDTLVLAGSLPPALPPETYALLAEEPVKNGAALVVDATGDILRKSLPCRPFLIKPNLQELADLFHTEPDGVEAVKACAHELQRQGARNVAVSLGSQGALLACEDGRDLFCRALTGDTVSTLGAGDSFVAGFLFGHRLHGTPEGALSWGIAAGAATAFTMGIAEGEQVKKLFPKVRDPHPV